MIDSSKDWLLDQLEQQPSVNLNHLRKLKERAAKRSAEPLLTNSALLERYREDVRSKNRRFNPEIERSLQLNAIRSTSGVATITVLTKPFPCPGQCVYCPTEAQAPKSYLPSEPPVMRALAQDYDPAGQLTNRLQALSNTGHPTDKVELIIKGGTWSAYPVDYQEQFIRSCFDAANQFGSSGDVGSASLELTQICNETAKVRVVGLTIETRPDWINREEVLRLRRWGVTRVELGVQSLDESVLALTVRDHGVEAVQKATRFLKEAGLKVTYHWMPNLPGATPEGDEETFRLLFEDPAYRPDGIKIYPCVVVPSAQLHSWWKEGRYTPYDDSTLMEVISRCKGMVPPTVRIDRIVRDIDANWVQAGCRQNNLRQVVQSRMKEQGLSCRCIRCREVRKQRKGKFQIVRREEEAAGGKEIFLSFEDPATDQLAALLRLRIPSAVLRNQRHWVPELDGAALIRELHTYGWQLPMGSSMQGTQHRGLGKRLMECAEQIVREEFHLDSLAVIAGVGVRTYYSKLGYQKKGSYMIKQLQTRSPCR